MKNSIAAFAALGLAAGAAAGSIRDFGAIAPKLPKNLHNASAYRGKQKKPEEAYRDLIKAGIVKVVRRRGKPPQIIWL